MELIDTHCHLTFKQLIENLDALLQRSREANVTGWLTVGTDPEHNQKCVELAQRHKNIYAAVGIHPHEAKDAAASTFEDLKTLAKNNKVLAVGETGLDFHYEHSNVSDQKRVFLEQLKIADELDKPVVIHSREAFNETMDILDNCGLDLPDVVFHCFTGGAEQAKKILDAGFFISFTGVVTFKNAQSVREAAKIVPLDRLMIETDCPYICPEPVRNKRPNEPAFMIHTANFLANLKKVSINEFAQIVTDTSRDFFAMPELISES